MVSTGSEGTAWYKKYGNTIYELEWFDQWLFSFYDSINVLFSADLSPVTGPEYTIMIVFLFLGALVNAYVFGTLTVIVEMMDSNAIKIQDLLTIAVTSMKNIHLREAL